MQSQITNFIEILSNIVDDLNHYHWNDFLGTKPLQWENQKLDIIDKIFHNMDNLLNNPLKILCCYSQFAHRSINMSDELLLRHFLLEGVLGENTQKFFPNVVAKLKKLITTKQG